MYNRPDRERAGSRRWRRPPVIELALDMMRSPMGNGDSDNQTGTVGLEPAGRTYARLPKLRLRTTEGPDAKKLFSSEGERTVIGTHESVDVELTDQTVSRFHCELAVSDGQIVIRDLGSRNGTKVNGVRVLQAHVDDGDVLTVGRTKLELSLAGDHVDVPLSGKDQFGNMVGGSQVIRAVFATLERAAKTDATVLLTGPTGAGKDVAAESIHNESARADQPLVVVDAGAIPAGLLESELFGHEKGAFTGAERARVGAFEAANGGTLFLDEIGELSLELQPKLLRALDRREVQRVGGSGERIPVDVRVIAATNRDLKAEVNAGRFRADLYYRLAVIEVYVPPLRDRIEDIRVLAEHLVSIIGATPEQAEQLLTEAFYEELERHAWPGNVRELRNYLERCLAMGQHVPIATAQPAASDRAIDIDFDKPLPAVRDEWTLHIEREYVAEMLRRHKHNVTAAARAAGVDRTSFYRLMTRCGLRD